MKIKALRACNGGGERMVVGKIYDVPDRDGVYLINTKSAELSTGKESGSAPAPAPGVSTKNGPGKG